MFRAVAVPARRGPARLESIVGGEVFTGLPQVGGRLLIAEDVKSLLHGFVLSLDDSVESLGSERGIITKVEIDVTLERAIGVERGPAAAAHLVALVGALP
jgi:hypothetical protein